MKILERVKRKIEKNWVKFMIPVNITINDIVVKSIEADELKTVLILVNESEDNQLALGRENPMNYYEIEQRYLETLMNSLEFFCGIYLNNKLIGIIKGRIENKTEKELWILSYLFIKEYRNKGMGSEILKLFEEHFQFKYYINKFCILIMENNEQGQKFWERNAYSITRITKAINFNNVSEMVILEKKIVRNHISIF